MSRIRNAKSDFDQQSSERVKSFSGLIFSWQNRSVGDQQQQKAWKSKKVELVWPILIMNKTSVVPRAEFEWNYVGMLVEWSASKLPIKDFLGHISVDLRVHEHLCISLRALWVPPLALVPFLKGANWFFFTCITIRNITTYIHEEIMKFWIYLKLSQNSAQKSQIWIFQKRVQTPSTPNIKKSQRTVFWNV